MNKHIDFNQNLEGLVYNNSRDFDHFKRSRAGVIFQSVVQRHLGIYAMDWNGNRTQMAFPGDTLVMGSFKEGLIGHNSQENYICAAYIDGTAKKFEEDVCPATAQVSVPVIKTFPEGFSAVIDPNMLALYFMDGRILELEAFEIGMGSSYAAFNNGIARQQMENAEPEPNDVLNITTITEVNTHKRYPFTTGSVNMSHKESLPWSKKLERLGRLGAIKDGFVWRKSGKVFQYWSPIASRRGELAFGHLPQMWDSFSNGVVISRERGKKLEWTCKTLDGDEWKMMIDEPYAWWHAYG